MTVKELKAALAEFDDDSEVAVYDDDNDRRLAIMCISEDEDPDNTANPPDILIFC